MAKTKTKNCDCTQNTKNNEMRSKNQTNKMRAISGAIQGFACSKCSTRVTQSRHIDGVLY